MADREVDERQRVVKDPANRRMHQRVDPETRRLRWLFNSVGHLLPGLAARIAEDIWRRVRVYPAPPRERAWRKSAETRWLDVDGRKIRLWCWGPNGGEGEQAVLLVHGWAGRGSQMGAFVAPLVEAGYRVIAPDLPGHGDDQSRQTDVAACARVLLVIEREQGPLAGLVAHSFGVVASSLACREGLAPRRLVGIGSPAFGERMLGLFCEHLRMPARVERAFHRRMARRLGEDYISRLSAAENARHAQVPALILHDAQDRAVSWESGKAVAENWAGGAEFRQTTGLGHFRILGDRGVIAQVTDFISAP